MSVFGVEKFLFQLGQNQGLRSAYRADRESAAAQFDLADDELKAVAAIDLHWLVAHGVNPILLLRFNMTGEIPTRETYLKLLTGEEV
jgi:hypothetical protein